MDEIAATAAVCTYNGAGRLPDAIRYLACQTGMDPAHWEILVVDNASSDGTGDVCRHLAPSSPVPLRVVSEPEKGLAHARMRAAGEARGRILCFLDDDNLAAPAFVSEAVRFFDATPRAGNAGGKVSAQWEEKPTDLALRVCEFALAICDRGDSPFRYAGISEGPVGAGMCIRRDVLREIGRRAPFAASVLGRSGPGLGSGEDAAISVRVKQLGHESWYAPGLRVAHVIPAGRMAPDYLARLYEGIGRGQARVRSLYDWKMQNVAFATLIGGRDLARWAVGRLRIAQACGKQGGSADAERLLDELELRQVLGRALEALPFTS